MTTTVAVSRTAQITDASGTVPLDPRLAATEQFLSVPLTASLKIVLLTPIASGSVLTDDDFDGVRFRIIRPLAVTGPQATVYDRNTSHVLRSLAANEWAEFMWSTLGGSSGQWRTVAAGAL